MTPVDELRAAFERAADKRRFIEEARKWAQQGGNTLQTAQERK